MIKPELELNADIETLKKEFIDSLQISGSDTEWLSEFLGEKFQDVILNHKIEGSNII